MPITNCLLIRRSYAGHRRPGNAELGREFAADGNFAPEASSVSIAAQIPIDLYGERFLSAD